MTDTPLVVRTRAALAEARDRLPTPVAVVMTMGALHEGHAALIRRARDLAGSVLVTVFVNPLQFGAGEDFDRYPRTEAADLEMCRREGVAVVFAPSVGEVYSSGEPGVRVQAGPRGAVLEGASRPGHFDGMLTVVLKLLHLTRPDLAVYGEKDAQQLALIRQMVDDLDVPVRIVGAPIVRAADGLALSSRNQYLSAEERQTALSLSRALLAGAAAGPEGADAVMAAADAVLTATSGLQVDYLALVDESTWDPPGPGTRTARLLVAARVGTTRLIDNMSVDLGTHVG